jgi:hypothetical protein
VISVGFRQFHLDYPEPIEAVREVVDPGFLAYADLAFQAPETCNTGPSCTASAFTRGKAGEPKRQR